MPLLKRLRVMAAKIETTIGTAETLAGADGAFNAYDTMIQPSLEMQTREGEGTFNYLTSVPGQYKGSCTFRTDLGWDGTSTEPTWASVLLPACGWADTAGNGAYTPRSEAPGTNVKTLTIAAYINGMRKILAGAVGNFQIVLPTGRMAYIDWSFEGVWQAPTDVAILAPTYPTALPLRFALATASFNSVALTVEQMTINAGNQLVMRESPTTAAGLISGIITDRRPTIVCNPEANLVATQDRFGIWLAQTEAAISIVLDGPGTSTISIAAPKAQIINDQEGDRNRIVTDEVEFQCNKNAATADQELTMTFAV